MNYKKANLHIHSLYSDGIHFPWVIVKIAKILGVQVLSITDHNEIAGTLKGLKYARKSKIIYFPGIETTFSIKGKVYELLAYFYDADSIKGFYREFRYQNGFMPHFKKIDEVTNLIRKHQGVVVAPHPFGRKGIFRKLRHRGFNVDGVEVINAFTAEKRNKKARHHEDTDFEYKRLGAADMHFFIRDISKVYTELISKEEITKEKIWHNFLRKQNDIKFVPRGNSFPGRKIMIQKPLCGVIYALNYPRLYLRYRFAKNKYKKTMPPKNTNYEKGFVTVGK